MAEGGLGKAWVDETCISSLWTVSNALNVILFLENSACIILQTQTVFKNEHGYAYVYTYSNYAPTQIY